MMFIVRRTGAAPARPGLRVAVTRKTPDIVPNAAGKTDYFCVGGADDITVLREAGYEIVELRDGWYADDAGGGVGISGHGRYWEIRDAPLTVREAARASGAPATTEADGGTQVNVRKAEADGGTQVNVRKAIFGV
jgi:hypothetical protein